MINLSVRAIKRNRALAFLIWAMLLFARPMDAQVRITSAQLPTYPFADPDPVPRLNAVYPYFRYDGYSTRAVDKAWTLVELENEFIRVRIYPEIGGKVWGAIDKATGHEFIYDNPVVKFRDIALRGPWTSGGIEFNFGLIGHAPTCATPVDYRVDREADGSVSCTVGSLDLASRTLWRVQIRVPKDAAYFETNVLWSNPTALHQGDYHWMNAAVEASDDMQLCFPGHLFIGHDGRPHAWPIDNEGRDLSIYGNNAFGAHKSYHVIGSDRPFFGGIWRDRGVGFGHWAPYSDKPGRKIWIWSLARSGAIWRDLLTDPPKPQYVEVQSGRSLNQAAFNSSETPFKNSDFAPHRTYRWQEIWFPLRGLTGLDGASPQAAWAIAADGEARQLQLCPLQPLRGNLWLTADGDTLLRQTVDLAPLQTQVWQLPADVAAGALTLGLDDQRLGDLPAPEDRRLHRPIESPQEVDWHSVSGLTVSGCELMRQRLFAAARQSFEQCLQLDPLNRTALCRLAELELRRDCPDSAAPWIERALAIDTYDATANWLAACLARRQNRLNDALVSLDFAARDLRWRATALGERSKVSFLLADPASAEKLARQALEIDPLNLRARELLAVSLRRQNRPADALECLAALQAIDPLSHFCRFERSLLDPTARNISAFRDSVRGELPHESFLELALSYVDIGATRDALAVLGHAPEQPIVDYWRAWLLHQSGQEAAGLQALRRAQSSSIHLVLPFRRETLQPLAWAEQVLPHWKNIYYRALILYHLDRRDAAVKELVACGDRIDAAPALLLRAEWLQTTDASAAAADLLRARRLAPDEWRCWHRLSQFYLQTGPTDAALQNASRACQRFSKDNFLLALDLVKAQLGCALYPQALDVLAATTILPYEGAREGHDLYRQAHLLQAARLLRHQKPDDALDHIAAARLWPEHLGVGKPFAIDERPEDYLQALCLQADGRIDPALELYRQIARSTGSIQTAADYLAVRSLRLLGREQEAADKLQQSLLHSEMAAETRAWLLALESGTAGSEPTVADERPSPWHPHTGDPSLPLLQAVLAELDSQ
ncbi:MAG TPA: DUF5107 domain-containing protein [bacterium]|nr:DUF5107 domain-containing protein [bacterium]HPG44313.1 DUF5107 domain-containing protein [bacterium]HPM96680.1 DUF5107 domain-containing protein [bacterium]